MLKKWPILMLVLLLMVGIAAAETIEDEEYLAAQDPEKIYADIGPAFLIVYEQDPENNDTEWFWYGHDSAEKPMAVLFSDGETRLLYEGVSYGILPNGMPAAWVWIDGWDDGILKELWMDSIPELPEDAETEEATPGVLTITSTFTDEETGALKEVYTLDRETLRLTEFTSRQTSSKWPAYSYGLRIDAMEKAPATDQLMNLIGAEKRKITVITPEGERMEIGIPTGMEVHFCEGGDEVLVFADEALTEAVPAIAADDAVPDVLYLGIDEEEDEVAEADE